MDETENDDRQKNRDSLIKTKDKSEDDFEKNLLLITSGTLVLSLTFIEKIAPLEGAGGIIYLIIAWTLLVISLLLNLFSHQLAIRHSNEYVDRLDRGIKIYNINNLIKSNGRMMACINNWTVGFMISGIISLVVYCSINAYRMAKTPKTPPPVASKAHVGIMKNGRQTTALVGPKPITVKAPPKGGKSN